MAVGSPLFSLLKANCTVDVEAGVIALAGGSQWTWAAVASGVNVLLTTTDGQRDGNNGVAMQRDSCKVAGFDPTLTRSDVRFKVVTTVPGLAWLMGRYLMPLSGVPHAKGSGGLVKARINRTCTVQEITANPGTAL